jgi:PKD repeat protein
MLLAYGIQAQNWKAHMADPNHNFYATQKEFYKALKKEEKELRKQEKSGKRIGEKEAPSYEIFKRWEDYMEPRVYPSGDVKQTTRAFEEYQHYMQIYSAQRGGSPAALSSTWMPMGPFGDPSGGNAGRVNALRFDPLSPIGLWAATPDGGLWNTPNQGTHWTTNTDALTVLGSSDVVFDPTNAQTMYLATGDGDAGDSYSIGVMKSTDGGANWQTTGLSWAVSARAKIYKMLINPLNKNVIMAATTMGVFRSEDAGTTWSNLLSGAAITDMEWCPNDTATVYAVSSDFYKSTDGGRTYSIITGNLPANTAVDRLAIAVTPGNPSFVYVVGSDANSDGFFGFYQSTDKGTTFTAKATATPNLLGWAYDGSDQGGQGWYTLSIAASPTNPDEVVVGGVNIWQTKTAGTTWQLFGQWTGQGAPYVHADIHDLIYQTGSSIYAGTDGGVFNTSNNGTSWTAVNGNMNIAEIYKMGLSKNRYDLAIAGHQDNGTNIYTTGWNETMGGDGMSAFVDWSNDKVMYGEQYSGSFNITTDGGVSWTGITTGLTGRGAWNTPWHQDPITPTTIYGGYQQMFKSVDQGTTWKQIGTLPGTSGVVEFAVAPSNPQIIYVIQGKVLAKTINGGTAWTNITGTLPVTAARITNVAVKDNDPNHIWVTFSGYVSGTKIFMSTDGGATWTNYSTGLPNLPTNCVAYCKGSKNATYVGCDVGIFYRDTTMSAWMPYNTGLPNVSVHDLQIFYPLGKIRAATFGRGAWEADLYNDGTLAPLANFAADKKLVCPGSTVNFSDKSTFTPTSWSWSFSGGTPAVSTSQNPSVVYSAAGTYAVALTATNANGSNTMTKTVYINVIQNAATPLVEGFESVATTFPADNWVNYDYNNDGVVWLQNTSVGRNSGSCAYFDNYDVNAMNSYDELRTPLISVNANAKMLYFDVAYAPYDNFYSDTLAVRISQDCWQTATVLYLKGGRTLATAPNDTVNKFVPTPTQWRTDSVSLAAYIGISGLEIGFQNRGHNAQPIYLDNINISNKYALGVKELGLENNMQLYPNPSSNVVNLDFSLQEAALKHIQVLDARGKVVYTTSGTADRFELNLENLSAGLYLIQVNVGDRMITRKLLKK